MQLIQTVLRIMKNNRPVFSLLHQPTYRDKNSVVDGDMIS